MQGERSKCVRGRKVMDNREKIRRDPDNFRCMDAFPHNEETMSFMERILSRMEKVKEVSIRLPERSYLALRGAWSAGGYTPWRDQKVS